MAIQFLFMEDVWGSMEWNGWWWLGFVHLWSGRSEVDRHFVLFSIVTFVKLFLFTLESPASLFFFSLFFGDAV